MFNSEIFLADATATIAAGAKLGAALGQALTDGRLALPLLITLTGDLGAGKTTFTQGLGQSLGVKDPNEIISPTFTLANEYQGHVSIFHLDLYRLPDQEQFYEAGLDEYLTRSAVTLIEWPDRLPYWPDHRLDVALTFKDKGRVLYLSPSPSVEKLLIFTDA